MKTINTTQSSLAFRHVDAVLTAGVIGVGAYLGGIPLAIAQFGAYSLGKKLLQLDDKPTVVPSKTPPPSSEPSTSIPVFRHVDAALAAGMIGIGAYLGGIPLAIAQFGAYSFGKKFLQLDDKPTVVPSKAPPPSKAAPQNLALTSSEHLLTASNLVRWGLIGASLYGVAPAVVGTLGTIASVGSEIATYCMLPEDASLLRRAMTFPILAKAVMGYSPLMSSLLQASSLWSLVTNSTSKIYEACKNLESDPINAAKTGTVHLFNLASGVTFAADSVGLIQLTPGSAEAPEKTKPKEPCDTRKGEICTKSTPKTGKREIRLATVYHNNNNPRRQVISDLTTANHRKYAERWNLGHDIVTENLVEGECTNPFTNKAADCSLYWNKIKYYKNWCEEPKKPGIEEWSIYTDDDAAYTNFQVDPSDAINRLRGSKDTSFIIATEGEGTRCNPGAVNMGVLIVRKDAKGCGVIDRIWENRNVITDLSNGHCPTFGLCKDQSNADEQGATDKVFWSDAPKVIGRDVTRILARDPSHPLRGHIALNTLNRGGCFRAQNADGTLGGPFDISNHDLRVNPDGIWQEGDWIVQTAGYPLYGQDLSHQARDKCADDPSIPIEPIRLKKVEQLIAAADRTLLKDPRTPIDSYSKPIETSRPKKFQLCPNKPAYFFQNDPLARKITIGTAYDNGGSQEREQISQFVNANHAEYARRWNIEHQIVSKNLVEGECTDPKSKKQADCAAFWNKIQMLRGWLREPKDPNVDEEWRYYADDDMLVMNRGINPDQAIDQLREGSDTSVIVAEDVIDWQKWFFEERDPHLSVNTGVIIVRKDKKAIEFIEAIWRLRNSPVEKPTPDCPTIGMCKVQSKSMQEQEAMTMVLRENPDLEGDVITIVAPRDTTSPMRKNLAMNTFYRKGCFTRNQKGWAPEAFSYEKADQDESPNGAFQKGDWLVQVAGVPVIGKELPYSNGYCKDIPGVKEGPLRFNKLGELAQHIVD